MTIYPCYFDIICNWLEEVLFIYYLLFILIAVHVSGKSKFEKLCYLCIHGLWGSEVDRKFVVTVLSENHFSAPCWLRC